MLPGPLVRPASHKLLIALMNDFQVDSACWRCDLNFERRLALNSVPRSGVKSDG
jgi:hypothetical protein